MHILNRTRLDNSRLSIIKNLPLQHITLISKQNPISILERHKRFFDNFFFFKKEIERIHPAKGGETLKIKRQSFPTFFVFDLKLKQFKYSFGSIVVFIWFFSFAKAGMLVLFHHPQLPEGFLSCEKELQWKNIKNSMNTKQETN